MKLQWITSLIILILLLTTVQAAWWNNDWAYKQQITLNTSGAGMGGNVTNDHVILIDINSEHTTFWANVDSNGNDVRWLKSDETTEIEFDQTLFRTDTDRAVYALEITDTFESGSDMTVYLYYGASGKVHGGDLTGAYPAAYTAFYHMEEASGTLRDSTGTNANAGIGVPGDYRTTNYECAIGHCIDFNLQSYYALGYNHTGDGELSLIAWTYPENTASSKRIFGARDVGTNYMYYMNVESDGDTYASMRDNTGSPCNMDEPVLGAEATLQMRGFRWDEGQNTSKAFTNTTFGTGCTGSDGINTNGLNAYLGAENGDNAPLNHYGGTIDEFRFFNYEIADDEVKLIYYLESGNRTIGAAQDNTGVTDINVMDPNGGETIWTSQSYEIDFNVTMTETITDTLLDINYSTNNTEGTGTALISDTNANSGGTTCTEVNDNNIFTCTYTWTAGTIPAGTYYILVNARYGTDDLFDASDATFTITDPSITINVQDEETGATLSGVDITWENDTNTLTTGATGQIRFFLENAATVNNSRNIFRFEKSGYATRYYEIDLNRYSLETVNFLLAEDDANKGRQWIFKMHDENAEAVLTNAYVEIRRTDMDYNTASRRQTDSQGLIDIYLLHDIDTYNFYITDGTDTYDYNAMNLTINKPLDEVTLQAITGNWMVTLDGIIRYHDWNLSAATSIYTIYSNTYDTFEIKVDTNSTNDYYPRYFSYRRTGIYDGQPADWNTLEPYLISIDDGTPITFTVIEDTSEATLPGALVNIYKNINGDLKLITSRVTNTDAKIKVYLEDLETYHFEVFYAGQIRYIDGQKVRAQTITGPTQTIRVQMNTNSLINQETSMTVFTMTPRLIQTTTTGRLWIINPLGSTFKIIRSLNGTQLEQLSQTTENYSYSWTMNAVGTYNIAIYKDIDGNMYQFIDWNFLYDEIDYNVGGGDVNGSEMTIIIGQTEGTTEKALFLISFIGLILIAIAARVTIDKGLETFMTGSILIGLITGGLVPWLIISVMAGFWMLARIAKGSGM